MTDPIDAAIAASEGEPVQVRLAQLQVALGSTGRPVMLAVPVDITPAEILDFVTWLAAVEGGLRSALPEKPSPIQIARALPGLRT